jgi:hypothetical protein
MHYRKVDQALDSVRDKLEECSSLDSAIEYLNDLESQIIEVPYGDVLYEYAWEYMQTIILHKFGHKEVSA